MSNSLYVCVSGYLKVLRQNTLVAFLPFYSQSHNALIYTFSTIKGWVDSWLDTYLYFFQDLDSYICQPKWEAPASQLTGGCFWHYKLAYPTKPIVRWVWKEVRNCTAGGLLLQGRTRILHARRILPFAQLKTIKKRLEFPWPSDKLVFLTQE